MYKRAVAKPCKLTMKTIAELIFCLSADGGDWPEPELWQLTKLDTFISPRLPYKKANYKYIKLISKCRAAGITLDSTKVRLLEAPKPGEYRIVVEQKLFSVQPTYLKNLVKVINSQKKAYAMYKENAYKPRIAQTLWADYYRQDMLNTPMLKAIDFCDGLIKKLNDLISWNSIPSPLTRIEEERTGEEDEVSASPLMLGRFFSKILADSEVELSPEGGVSTLSSRRASIQMID